MKPQDDPRAVNNRGPSGLILKQRLAEGCRLQAKELRKRMTKAECVLWSVLRNNQLSGLHFRRQQVVRGFILDFYCNPARLAIEVDGAIHDATHGYDAERDTILRSCGIDVVRVTNEAVFTDLNALLNEIAERALSRISVPYS